MAEADRVFAIAFRRNIGPRSLGGGQFPDSIRLVSASNIVCGSKTVRRHRLDGGPFVIAEFVAHDSRRRFLSSNHVPGNAINRQRARGDVATALNLLLFRRHCGLGIADLAGLATGSTRSRMTPERSSAAVFGNEVDIDQRLMMCIVDILKMMLAISSLEIGSKD